MHHFPGGDYGLDPFGDKWIVSADSVHPAPCLVVADTSRQETGRNYWLVSMERVVLVVDFVAPPTVPTAPSACALLPEGRGRAVLQQSVMNRGSAGLPLQRVKHQNPLLNEVRATSAWLTFPAGS